MPKKQKLKNKGNNVGNLTGKSQEQRLQNNRTMVSFITSLKSRNFIFFTRFDEGFLLFVRCEALLF